MRKQLLVVIGLALAGCASPIFAPSRQSSSPERVVFKNYVLGITTNAFVGDAVVKCRDYTVARISENKLRASCDFSIDGGGPLAPIHMRGRQGEEFVIFGRTKRRGQWCSTVQPAAGSGVVIIIGPDGQFTGRARNIHAENELMYRYIIDPPETRFEPVITERIDSRGGSINFEFLYNGRTDDSLNFQYREYTAGDLARPAFSQSLTYPAGAKTVRFRKLLLRIETVAADQIFYQVVEDGF